ncbi:MAG: acylphosphatase, partial [Burkholderiaceae bacterium]|nr:acylphosphatase [Burkholderiaceae bacterium]
MPCPPYNLSAAPIRLRIEVRGQVQGVGFRPFVHRLASAMGLGGWVRNVGAGVEIEVEGERQQVERFITRLQGEAPAAARIEQLSQTAIASRGAGEPFAIADSSGAATSTSIAPDSALCQRCIGEIFDPRNRRYRHPFTHCTD